MTRLPQLTARELVRFLKSQGFVEDRQTGSPLTLWHEGRRIAATMPVHTGTDIGIALSREKYCSVWHSLRPDIDFRTSFEIRKGGA